MDREQLLSEIMTKDFVLTDLRLFLNTHPCEKEALTLFNDTAKEILNLKTQFESTYGPFDGRSPVSPARFDWIDDPWPWQNTKNNAGGKN